MVFGDVLDRKDAFPEYKNMYLICSKNGKFSKGVNPSFRSKIRIFFVVFFLYKIGPEMMCGDVLDRKQGFLDDNNMYLICPKNQKFSKRVNP